MDIVGYDTETWSSNQISKGLEHYFADPDFAIICEAKVTRTDTAVWDDPGGPYGSTWVNCAHNMPFDRRANEAHFNNTFDDSLWFDTMVGVRAILGASLGRNTYISLEKSAKLLLPGEFHKDDAGKLLMEYFSFPSPKNSFGKIPYSDMIARHPHKWELYKKYCEQDALVAYHLADLCRQYLGDEAFERLVLEAEITYRMNRTGWPVDTHLLQVMTDKAQENTEQSIDRLIEEYNPGWSTVSKKGDEVFKPLNLNAPAQIRKWLLERDIDIPDAQQETIDETIAMVEDNLDLRPDWEEVLAVLQAKVDRGGATLKKLTPIANNVSADGRLRDMYNHIAAAATHRTTGSGVQMQNLKRLPDEIEPLTKDSIATMNNGELARNIRQLFKAQHPEGQIIVADLRSIEGLLVGWVFGVEWMVRAVRESKDMYQMNASTRFKVPYESVVPAQRRRSKTGVLQGNYGGGVRAYMKDGTLTEDEAAAEVKEYRSTIPSLVQSWWDLNDMILEAVDQGGSGLRLHNGYSVVAELLPHHIETLDDPSLKITMFYMGKKIFSRLWHGVRIELDEKGRSEVTYAVADERKTVEEPWKRTNTKDEKYKLYGGKLTGTLIQSLARELYFYQLEKLSHYHHSALRIIGQLHDEVVVEWQPQTGLSLERTEKVIEEAMSEVPWYLENCPVRVKVSHAPRYIK